MSRFTRINNVRHLQVERHDNNGVTLRFEQTHPVRKVVRVRLEWWQVQSLRDQFASRAKDQAEQMRLRATSIERQGGTA